MVVSRAARLRGPDGERSVTVEDLSLNGVLLHLTDPTALDANAGYTLTFPLGGEAVIAMDLRPARQDGALAGFHCRHIDLDSAVHLRRLVEHNLGDPDLVHRELGEMGTG